MLIFSGSILGCGSGTSLAPLDIPQTNDVIFIGDSITAHWPEYQGFKAHSNWIDKGISGQRSFEIAQRYYKDVISLYPKTVHILVGTNDVYPGWKPCVAPSNGIAVPTNTCSNILYMVQMAQHFGINVVIGTIPPWGCTDNPYCNQAVADETSSRYNRIIQLNNFIKAFALENKLAIVDYHTILADATDLHYAQNLTLDGVHPSAQGYELMTGAVAAALK